MSKVQIIVFNNIKLPINASIQEAFSVARKKRNSVIGNSSEEFFVYKRSIDARKKDNVIFVYSIASRISDIVPDQALMKKHDASVLTVREPEIEIGERELSSPPVIVGSGPCGLFCALLLAEWGYAPILLERGDPISTRKIAVDKFYREHILDPESNIQFGAGGAGTFSDGKLVTRTNDPLCNYVLGRFVEFGAPSDIEFIAKPHVGTDILSLVVDRMLSKIEELGGKVYYNTKFISPISDLGRVKGVNTSRGEIPAGALVLAVGHSARDTYSELIHRGFDIEGKSFSIGMRIEHLAEDIDRAMYGSFAGMKQLGHAEYNLSYNTKERGVYTFCMCPGGEVVAAASENGRLVVNGMSYHSRANVNSNSAVVCSVFKEDYGSTPLEAISFQRKIEEAAFKCTGGEYKAPIITVGDFISGQLKTEPKRIMPTYMNGSNVKLKAPEEYLPRIVTESIKGALSDFDKKIRGFACADAVLTGAETRTSAPIRIIRDPATRLASGYTNLYPAGEGAGYAGGITSAAIDGLKTAIEIIKIYRPVISR